MASNFNSEIESILVALRGSPWAIDPTVNSVIDEYGCLVAACKTLRHQQRRPALQILFSSRAIDTLLEFVVNRDRANRGQPSRTRVSIGQAINDVRPFIHPFVADDLDLFVRDTRNIYLHQAGIFPTDEEMELFLLASAIGISELVNKIP
jgi:hypothetical protein